MTATGRLDDGDLVLRRRFSATIDDVWDSITISERLARWFGTWTGDPATGTVMVTMNAEPEEYPAIAYDIEVCEPPRLLIVHSVDDYGTWHLRVEITEDGDDTVLELRQIRIDPSMARDVGPGWEWYLDRLVAAVADEQPPGIDAFEQRYMAMSDEYGTMVDDATD